MSGLPRFLRFSPSNSERIWRRGSADKCVGLSSRANFLRPGGADPDGRGESRRYSSCKPVRIGCASGFWGDTATSAPQLIYGGKLDFLVFDYLSEITMSLLTAARTKTPNLGYALDFVQVALAPFINDIHRKGIRVVSNAGGVNPLACAEAIQEVIKKAGLDLKVAVVTGDDLMPSRSLLSEVKMADGGGRRPLPKTLHSMNAYLGAEPIRRCLDLGADVVVTGRCVDSAVALGPLLHTFGWKKDDYDLLAAGSLAGHLIECGAQSTGGIFTDWHQVPDWDNMGFPVVECSSDGSFVLSKPPKTGGLVSFGTVAEQLVYEIADPRRYLLPDVICDFSQVAIQELPGVDGGAVRVTGARGLAPSPDYKVCATYMDGFRATAVCPVGGPRAAEKARRTADSIIRRTRRMFRQLDLEDFHSVNIQVLGAEDTYGPNACRKDCREAVIWMAVHHQQKKALEIFSREVAPAGTGMAPGLTGIVGGRPRVSPVLKPIFFLHPKAQIKVDIHVAGQLVESLVEAGPDAPEQPQDEAPPTSGQDEAPPTDLPSGPHSYRLEDLAYTQRRQRRLGKHRCDRSPSSLLPLPEEAPDFFCGGGLLLSPDGARRAERRHTIHSAGIHGLNFVLTSSLGGEGWPRSAATPRLNESRHLKVHSALRNVRELQMNQQQGKAFGQMLLDLKLKGLPDLKSLVD
ncbi:uncharacterized protein LOC129376497 [Poeciliopsis prolifica]|uniref:uncharacterized protein LOC129376497 n=1 Tax=Poeciliopsis prolifica TaxID=188132 RepID=UPI0024144390|nr:uncharacterized protein LOC129376497 [Poeciliopsis prolifica]